VQCDCLDAACMGSPPIIKALLLYSISIKIIGVAIWEGQGELQFPCIRLRYSNRAVGNSNKAHRIVKEVVYDHNHHNIHNHNNSVFKKVNKQVHKKITTRVGTTVDQKKVLKQVGVVHDIKLQ